MSEEKRLLKFLEELEDNYGPIVVDKDRKLTVISTGSLSLDVSIGVGGIPRGRFTELYGPESSGKTTLALSIAKDALSKGNTVLYVDAENGLDFSYIEAIIGDFDRDNFVLVVPESAEQAFEICEEAIASVDSEGIPIFNLIVLDSLAALSPEKEQKDKLTDANVALLPRVLTRFLRRNAYKVKNSDVAFLFLNQVRDKIGSYISGYETPGGHALKHFSTVRIALTKGQAITRGDQREKVGINAKFLIKKNKLAAPFRGHYIPIMFGEGIDYYRDVVEFAKFLGVLKQHGAYYRFENENIGQGVVKAARTLENNKETLDKIVKLCYNVINGGTNEG